MSEILGIVGGIGPESTIDYYRSIIASWRRQNPDGSYPRVIINSIDAHRMLRMIGDGELPPFIEEITAVVGQLAAAGATVALLAANTPHLVFDDVARAATIPMISIVDETCRAARARGLQRLGLFGTRFTMQAAFYPERFARDGLTIVLPEPDEQEYIHTKYMTELIPGTFLEETRRGLTGIIAAMRERSDIDGLILGGTELSLLLKEPYYDGVAVLDTTQIHVASAVEWMLGKERGAV